MEEERNKSETKAEEIKRDEHGLYLPGNPPGPGRPKGKTIKERVRDWLEEHPDDMASFVKHFVEDNRDLAWQMLEGRPMLKAEVTNLEPPKPILDDIQTDNGKENPLE